MRIKILLIILIVIILLAIGCYFVAKYILVSQNPPEYFFVHPTIAKVFNINPVCPTDCLGGGVCGRDGKNYCNQCVAFQNKAGYAHDGQCDIVYKNDEYGFAITLPATWEAFIMQKKTWSGHLIENSKETYSGPLLLIINPALKADHRFTGIPIMVFTPDVWAMVSGPNPAVAISAAPIGPAKIGENSKYVFATPPRYIGFGDDLNADQINEIYEIVKTFKTF
jgi:hypothetical protein